MFIVASLLTSVVFIWFSIQSLQAITGEVCSINDLPTGSNNTHTITKSHKESDNKSLYIDIDLGTKQRVCFIDIHWNKTGIPFQILASSYPESNYTQILTDVSKISTTDLPRYDFQDISARNIRLLVFGDTISDSVIKINVYSYSPVSSGSRLPELPPLPLYDNFENKSETDEKWDVVYTSEGFAGNKKQSHEDHLYRMYPKTSKGKCTNDTLTTCTHAVLVTSKDEFSNFRMVADVRTDEQLRKKSPPNTWEVAWIFFRYKDTFHYYWIALKPNGIELGKKDCNYCTNPVDGQINLITAPLPTLKIGEWSQWSIQTSHNQISVYVDGNKVIDFTDAGMSDGISSGKIAMYTEDAKVSFDNFYVSEIA